MSWIGDGLCRLFCPERTPKEEIERLASLSADLRKASHDVANATMEVRGSSANLNRASNAFLELVNSLERGHRNGK